MKKYIELLNEARDLGFNVIEKSLKSHAKGLCVGRTIVISADIETNKEKKCVLMEEIAHAMIAQGNILDVRQDAAMEREYCARSYAYEILAPMKEIMEAWCAGCTTTHAIAVRLCVTDEFINGAIEHYNNKYKKIV